MADTVNMSLSQRLLVVDAHRQSGEERDGSANSGGDDVGGDREPSGNTVVETPRWNTLVQRRNLRRESLDQVDFRPTCYHPGGIFEELPRIAPEMLHDPKAEGQSWGMCSGLVRLLVV